MKLLVVCAVALAVAASAAVAPARRSVAAADCSRVSTGFAALTDLGTRLYAGYRGGLYPGGRNALSAAYLKRGLAYTKLVKARDETGKPSGLGKVVLLSVGMSNTTQEFSVFKRAADSDPQRSRSLVVVDGAQGGQDAEIVKDPSARFWTVLDGRLRAAGVTAAQVQAVWLKEAIARPSEPFPSDALRLQADLRTIVGVLRARFPNLRLIYASSRTYGGYATTALNPEPYSYQSGFAVKWLVQERIENKLRGPWIGWGPYLWTDGTKGRADGLVWTCQDVREDGTHPSSSGARKVSEQLLRFFKTNRTARPWFVRSA